MGRWFSVLVYQSPLGPIPGVSVLVGVWQGSRICISYRFPGDAAGPALGGGQVLLEESPSSGGGVTGAAVLPVSGDHLSHVCSLPGWPWAELCRGLELDCRL